MKKPIFSVLIANYNYAKFLKKAVNSVLKQTSSSFEIIIVDDGSTDNSPEVIRSLLKTDPRIRAFRQENNGQAAAFNRAFAESQGEIVSFLDADDLWLPEKLEWTQRMLANSKKTALLQHNMYILRKRGPKSALYRPTLVSGDVVDDIAQMKQVDFFVPTSGLAVHRNILSKVMPIPTQFKICADAYITRAVLAHGSLFSLNIPLGYYRIHGDNYWIENPNRANPGMVRDQVMPVVLDYYRNCGMRNVSNVPTNTVCQEGMMIAHLMRERVIHLKTLYSRIAIYGAGAHTRWLMDLLNKTGVYPDQMPTVDCILDDNADKCCPVQGFPVSSTSSADPGTFDAIILSSDCFQDAMKKRLSNHSNTNNKPTIDLYEGLPPGPYAKIPTDVFLARQEDPKTTSFLRENKIAIELISERLRTIQKQHPRIALYGPTGHIERLTHLIKHIQQTSPENTPAITAIMMDEPSDLTSIADMTVKNPTEFDSHEYDAIITMHPNMQNHLRLLMFPTPPLIINIYEGLPAAPYMCC